MQNFIWRRILMELNSAIYFSLLYSKFLQIRFPGFFIAESESDAKFSISKNSRGGISYKAENYKFKKL